MGAMVSEQLLLSVGLGTGLGVAYVFISFLSNRRALRSDSRFLLVVVGAMMLRMLIALVILIVVVLMLPVSDAAFLGSFFVIFAVGIAAEISMLHRRQRDSDTGHA